MSKEVDCGGLPPDICEQLATEEQIIKIRLETRRFGKQVTVIEGIDEKQVNYKDLASKLKSELAAGGTYKDGRIELQGDHRKKVKDILIKMGFQPDNIMIIE
ncbi:translation initiation factor SUI1, putative, prokaryotic [Caldisphaera lagunensis DSM 15908]|uniref:Protein translation factor SUI1 homolog n=1 Tax=Caldisphaera lagunensis (strain DSM 15908 / JCM 11604 / ANMR 0165 / IC-154) TaxID=1056495 RepID=L0ACQ5_CALLD|nr:stress response translation initiation inhibitor YciH [Caldisphaera lagunensis]AFZ70840.1 translation initiation factor SUI1, putative, prokaryotic [Caldisphaera lagunensis DSM 15908]